ncbi:MAG: hypothetical protein IJ752_06640 [Alphaproteobacteria bacterium]|nr:hypothetical protein [Alphaproteobacteria bacterium]
MSVEEKLAAKKMAAALAFICMKDYFQYPFKKGQTSFPKEEYADVFITDVKGRQLLHCQACHMSVMENIADGIYDFLLNIETDAYVKRLEDAYHASVHWKKAHASKIKKKKH